MPFAACAAEYHGCAWEEECIRSGAGSGTRLGPARAEPRDLSMKGRPRSGFRTSVAAEVRLALLEKCGEALGAILGEKAVGLQTNFFVESLFQFFVVLADHGALHIAVGNGRPGGQALAQLAHPLGELLLGIDLVDDTDAVGLFGRQF